MKRLLPAVVALSLLLPLLLGAGVRTAPEPEPIGNLEGTWYYTDPGFQIAIFVWRDNAGTLRLKYHLRAKSGTEYETDAGGFAKLIEEGNLVTVLFTGAPAGPYSIKGYHERTVRSKETTVTQSGDFTLYLAEKGQKLILNYPELKTATTGADGRITSTVQTDVNRIFRRASTIVVDFSEIPF